MNKQTTATALKLTSRLEKTGHVIKGILQVSLLLFLLVAVLWTGYSIYSYVGDHNFLWRSPVEIKVQTPLQIVKRREVVLKEVKTQIKGSGEHISVSAEEVRGSNVNGVITAGESLDEKLERVYDVIWLHESGRGTNKSGLNGYCINNGLGINQVGYAPADNFCFKDEAEQKATVLLWFRNRLGKDCVKRGSCFDTVEQGLKIYNSNSYVL